MDQGVKQIERDHIDDRKQLLELRGCCRSIEDGACGGRRSDRIDIGGGWMDYLHGRARLRTVAQRCGCACASGQEMPFGVSVLSVARRIALAGFNQALSRSRSSANR